MTHYDLYFSGAGKDRGLPVYLFPDKWGLSVQSLNSFILTIIIF